MDLFYAIKEPVSHLVNAMGRTGLKIIPSEQKGVFMTLFFIIFATITGVGIVVPLLPIYAHDMGAAGIYVALIFGAFSLSRTCLLPVFGRMSDRRGRKPFILAGLLIYGLISLAFVFSSRVETLILARFFQGMGSAMIMPVVQAYVGEITPEGTEGYSMGLFNLSMFLSLSLGPLLGGSILDLWSMDAAFFCMGGLSLLAFGLCLVFLPPPSQEGIPRGERVELPWKTLMGDWGFRGLLSFRYVYTACIGTIWCFLPLYADQAFGLTGTQIGFLVMLGVFISGLLQLPMGYLADRADKRRMGFVGGIVAALGMGVIFKSHTFVGLLMGVSVFGIGGGIGMPAVTALAVIYGEAKGAMGTVMSVMTVAHSLGMLTGSLAAGIAMDALALHHAFVLAGALMVLGTGIFYICQSRQP
ncbi:MAG: MFS transporter [Desulfobacterales bacterium]|nr:MFS transporter [Desulfobacterales bacterium]